jgi:hypothetical protein
VLLRWARENSSPSIKNTLLAPIEQTESENAMRLAIEAVEQSMQILKKTNLWSPNLKASDDVLRPVLENYYERLGRPAIIQKSRFHELIPFLKVSEVDSEIRDVLNEIHRIAKSVKKDDST